MTEEFLGLFSMLGNPTLQKKISGRTAGN